MAGADYPASSAFKCSDGWSVAQVAIMVDGRRGYVDSIATAEKPTDLVFDREIQFATGLLGLGGAIYEHPSAKATKISKMEKGERYPATTAMVVGTASLSGNGEFVGIKLVDGRVGWVDTNAVVDAVAITPGSAAGVETVKMVVSAYGDGAPVIDPFVQPDPLAETHPLAGKGKTAGKLKVGDKYEMVQGAFAGISLSPFGILAEGLDSAFGEDKEVNELAGKWSMVVHGDQLAWVPAWALDTPEAWTQKLKDKAEKAKDWANGKYDELKGKYDERKAEKEAENGPSLLTWLSLIPAGGAAVGALVLTGFAARRRSRNAFDIVGKLPGWVGLVLAPALAGLAVTWIPEKALWWAWLVGIGIGLITVTPAALVLTRLVRGARNLGLKAKSKFAGPEPQPPQPIERELASVGAQTGADWLAEGPTNPADEWR